VKIYRNDTEREREMRNVTKVLEAYVGGSFNSEAVKGTRNFKSPYE